MILFSSLLKYQHSNHNNAFRPIMHLIRSDAMLQKCIPYIGQMSVHPNGQSFNNLLPGGEYGWLKNPLQCWQTRV